MERTSPIIVFSCLMRANAVSSGVTMLAGRVMCCLGYSLEVTVIFEVILNSLSGVTIVALRGKLPGSQARLTPWSARIVHLSPSLCAGAQIFLLNHSIWAPAMGLGEDIWKKNGSPWLTLAGRESWKGESIADDGIPHNSKRNKTKNSKGKTIRH